MFHKTTTINAGVLFFVDRLYIAPELFARRVASPLPFHRPACICPAPWSGLSFVCTEKTALQLLTSATDGRVALPLQYVAGSTSITAFCAYPACLHPGFRLSLCANVCAHVGTQLRHLPRRSKDRVGGGRYFELHKYQPDARLAVQLQVLALCCSRNNLCGCLSGAIDSRTL